MKIVHFLIRVWLEDGGVARAVLDLCALLASRGHEVVFLTPDGRDAPREWRLPDPGRPRLAEIHRGPIFNVLSPAALGQLRQHLAGADAVHLHGMWDLSNYQVAREARALGIPYIHSPHGMLDDWAMAQRRLKKRAFLALAGSRLLRRAAVVHCCSRGEWEESRRWFPDGAGRVQHLAFDLSAYHSLPGPDEARRAFPALDRGRPILLHLGRLHPVKGIEVLLEAAARLAQRGLECDVAIAGTGAPEYEARLRHTARQLGVEDRTAFLGGVFGRTKVSLLQAAAATVVPSIHENFGFVWAESLASGTPAVVSRGVKMWPELQASGGVAVVPERTPAAFADAIAELLAHPDRRSKAGQRGRAWALETLSADRAAAGMEALYRQVVRRPERT